MYTFNNNPYAVPTVYDNVENAAAGQDFLAALGTTVVYGSSSTNDDSGLEELVGSTSHGSSAIQGSPVSYAGVSWGDAAINMVFYTDDSGHIRSSVQVPVDSTPTWYENGKVRVQDGSNNNNHNHCGRDNQRRC